MYLQFYQYLFCQSFRITQKNLPQNQEAMMISKVKESPVPNVQFTARLVSTRNSRVPGNLSAFHARTRGGPVKKKKFLKAAGSDRLSSYRYDIPSGKLT